MKHAPYDKSIESTAMITNVSTSKALYVQYGCGLSCPDGWLNFDVSPRLRIENTVLPGKLMRFAGKSLFPVDVKFGDIVAGLPVAKESAQGIYCSHVLEHLDRSSVIYALLNTYSTLRPGGVFRLVVPDLTWRVQKFIDAQGLGNSKAADEFMEATYLGKSQPVSGLVGRLRYLFGNSSHKWMYDYLLMEELLADVGFVKIRRCDFGDAQDPMFALVEEKGRFYDDGNKELAIEALRP